MGFTQFYMNSPQLALGDTLEPRHIYVDPERCLYTFDAGCGSTQELEFMGIINGKLLSNLTYVSEQEPEKMENSYPYPLFIQNNRVMNLRPDRGIYFVVNRDTPITQLSKALSDEGIKNLFTYLRLVA